MNMMLLNFFSITQFVLGDNNIAGRIRHDLTKRQPWLQPRVLVPCPEFLLLRAGPMQGLKKVIIEAS